MLCIVVKGKRDSGKQEEYSSCLSVVVINQVRGQKKKVMILIDVGSSLEFTRGNKGTTRNFVPLHHSSIPQYSTELSTVSSLSRKVAIMLTSPSLLDSLLCTL